MRRGDGLVHRAAAQLSERYLRKGIVKDFAADHNVAGSAKRPSIPKAPDKMPSGREGAGISGSQHAEGTEGDLESFYFRQPGSSTNAQHAAWDIFVTTPLNDAAQRDCFHDHVIEEEHSRMRPARVLGGKSSPFLRNANRRCDRGRCSTSGKDKVAGQTLTEVGHVPETSCGSGQRRNGNRAVGAADSRGIKSLLGQAVAKI